MIYENVYLITKEYNSIPLSVYILRVLFYFICAFFILLKFFLKNNSNIFTCHMFGLRCLKLKVRSIFIKSFFCDF